MSKSDKKKISDDEVTPPLTEAPKAPEVAPPPAPDAAELAKAEADAKAAIAATPVDAPRCKSSDAGRQCFKVAGHAGEHQEAPSIGSPLDSGGKWA